MTFRSRRSAKRRLARGRSSPAPTRTPTPPRRRSRSSPAPARARLAAPPTDRLHRRRIQPADGKAKRRPRAGDRDREPGSAGDENVVPGATYTIPAGPNKPSGEGGLAKSDSSTATRPCRRSRPTSSTSTRPTASTSTATPSTACSPTRTRRPRSRTARPTSGASLIVHQGDAITADPIIPPRRDCHDRPESARRDRRHAAELPRRARGLDGHAVHREGARVLHRRHDQRLGQLPATNSKPGP